MSPSPAPPVQAFDPFSGPPRLHGARRVGIRPGTEVIHPIAVTGARPLRFDVTGLPHGLHVDADGVIRGTAPAAVGDVDLAVHVGNDRGGIDEVVTLCVGPTLALTPPMGWNSWNVYGEDVTADVIVRTAETMVANGMRDLGYQYVNIDDFWHADARDADGTPRANPQTFPDGIAAVAERIHALGLKLGIYSDAAHLTCGNCFGGYGYEELDAATYAEWGVDLLKYDYCHAPRQRAVAEDRYGRMSRALAASGRSIVLSVCEWGLRSPWRWAADLGGAYWRTSPDIFDTFGWSVMGVRGIAWWNMRLADHAGPGRWNDPDMLLVGNRGRGRSTGVVLMPGHGPGRRVLRRFPGLDDTQAHTHMTLWSMMAAPLLASHDLADSNDFDVALLTNPEILALNQDVLGVQGRRAPSPRGVWQLVKPLADGGVAVSFTNVGRAPRTVEADLSALGATGPLTVIDAWTGEDLGRDGAVRARLGRHASAVFVARPATEPARGPRSGRPPGPANP